MLNKVPLLAEQSGTVPPEIHDDHRAEAQGEQVDGDLDDHLHSANGVHALVQVEEHVHQAEEDRAGRGEQAKQEKRESRTGQTEFRFGLDSKLENSGHVDQAEVESYWLSKLSSEPRQFGTVQLADMIEETGWFESDFQAAFGALADHGIVANLDDETRRRRKKYVHFEAK